MCSPIAADITPPYSTINSNGQVSVNGTIGISQTITNTQNKRPPIVITATVTYTDVDGNTKLSSAVGTIIVKQDITVTQVVVPLQTFSFVEGSATVDNVPTGASITTATNLLTIPVNKNLGPQEATTLKYSLKLLQ